MRRLEVPAHAVGVHDQPVDEPGEPIEHVVEREERVGEHDPFGARVRDVTLVPQCDVLEPDRGGGADDAGEPADPLRDDRVALVRHRGRSLHSGGERLLDLPHLGPRQVPDLRREPVERCRAECEYREQLRVAVARDHLRGRRIRLEPEALARDALHLRFDCRVGSDRPRKLPDAVRLERPRYADPRTVELEGPASELPAERRRLCVDAV